MPRVVVAHGRDQWLPPYIEALEAGGLREADALPVRPDRRNGHSAAELIARADALLLTGGNDIEPRLYGEEAPAEAKVEAAFPERDRLELELVAEARASRLPTLGICRGMQVLNVALGGTLWIDLPFQAGIDGHDFPVADGWDRAHLAHQIETTGDLLPIQRWLGSEPLMVNSRHHQAVRQLGDVLQIAAVAPDGVVEAVACEDPDWWAWGVQWHPENLVGIERHRNLFREFLSAAENRR